MSSRRASLRLTVDAQRDLNDIDLHGLTEWGEQVARERHLRLLGTFQHLTDHQMLGIDRQDLGEHVRSFSLPPHIVVYAAGGNEVVILRIVHERYSLSVSDLP